MLLISIANVNDLFVVCQCDKISYFVCDHILANLANSANIGMSGLKNLVYTKK